MKKAITPQRIVNALKRGRRGLYRTLSDESYPMPRWELAISLGLTTKAENEELGRVLKRMWPRQYHQWGVSHQYYPTGWRVRLVKP